MGSGPYIGLVADVALYFVDHPVFPAISLVGSPALILVGATTAPVLNMVGERMVAGSLDVKSLYPQCKAKPMGQHIKEFFKRSRLDYQAINSKAMARYLALNGTASNNLAKCIPMPEGTTTLNSWLTTETVAQFFGPEVESCLAPGKDLN